MLMIPTLHFSRLAATSYSTRHHYHTLLHRRLFPLSRLSVVSPCVFWSYITEVRKKDLRFYRCVVVVRCLFRLKCCNRNWETKLELKRSSESLLAFKLSCLKGTRMPWNCGATRAIGRVYNGCFIEIDAVRFSEGGNWMQNERLGYEDCALCFVGSVNLSD